MIPTSLMTLPTNALKAAYARGVQASTQGERAERLLANVGLLLIGVMTVVMVVVL